MINLNKIMESFYKIGKRLAENDDLKSVQNLIIDLRAERTPGRFFEKLVVKIADYNKRIEKFRAYIPEQLMEKKLVGDEFYYVKAAILTGLINSLSSK